MTLFELLLLISSDDVPLWADSHGMIDCRPNTDYLITLRFMSEEDTAETVNLSSPLLIPWYDCEVYFINPSEKKNCIEAWLRWDRYVKDKWADKVKWYNGGQ